MRGKVIRKIVLATVLTFFMVAFCHSQTGATGVEGAPYFRACNVMASNTPGGTQTVVSAEVFDTNGTVPDTITSLTVVGPGGFTYSFTPDDYLESVNVYWHSIPGLPADGEYTFTVTDNEGKTATTHSYLEVGNIIPVPDSSTLQASGDPLAPTLSWGAVAGYEGNLFYRTLILDMEDNLIWMSGFTTETSIMVEPGVLVSGTDYQWRVDAFDSHYWDSNSRAVSQWVPLVIDNSRPFFQWAVVSSDRIPDGISTGLLARVTDPDGSVPASIQSLVVTGPGGFTYSFQPGDYSPVDDCFEHLIDGTRPLDGIYTFTLTDIQGNTAHTCDYVKVHDVPCVEASTLQASGDPLAPTLSWGAPAGMDQSLYSRVKIYDSQFNKVWGSSWTPLTSVDVEPGILEPGIPYQWDVRTVDDKRWVHYSNLCLCETVDLGINNARPYFNWASVFKLHGPDGMIYTQMVARVFDPNGTLPGSLVTLHVTGPGGFSQDLLAGSYNPGDNVFVLQVPGAPAEGVYTFTVEDNEGFRSVTHDYVKASDDVPLIDEGSILISGDPLAPTISWSGPSGYPGRLYYNVVVRDLDFNTVFRGTRDPFTAQSIPPGVLQEGEFYMGRIEANDHPDWVVLNSRSQTSWFSLPRCEEDDSGALDIPGQSGGSGGSITVPVRVQDAPNAVDSLGFEVFFDPTLFTYTGYTRGPLVEDFDFFDVSNPEEGVVRIGGFEAGPDVIAAGASGDLVYLHFDVGACDPGSVSGFALQELKDDLAGWLATHGCFQCGCDGDVSGDGEITPVDALCAFETYLAICPTSCGMDCEEVCCDVSLDADCTPADALCIFQKYLGLPSCLD